ncbi:MAG: hypothetical protein WBG94_19575 [Anaerolineales bacterium]
MVHALNKVNTCLCPGGYILVIHDLIQPALVEVHSQDRHLYAGQMFSDNGFENQRLADLAIDQVIQDGLFSSDRSHIFENFIRADSLESLLNWLADNWKSAYMTAGTQRKVGEMVAQMGSEAEVVLHLISRIVKLDPS